MNTVVQTNDSSAQLAVKDAVLARSGIYLYSRADVEEMGLKPVQDKMLYREYRPAGVLVQAKDKFNLVPVPKNHPPVDITADNFHQYASGVVGGPIEAVPLPDGEIGLQGKIAFFTRDAYDHYMSGNKETSAGYGKKIVYSEDPDKDGFDWVLTGITSVNHVAVLPEGRGGSNVRVMDKAAKVNSNGGTEMSVKAKSGFLQSLFGIGKAKDEKFKFSEVLLGSVAKVHTLDAAGLEKEVGAVMAHVNSLGDSEAKEVLVGAVTDCFKHPVEVLAQKDAISKKLDELYAKCQDADVEVVSRILDSADKKDDDKAGKDDEADEDGKKDAKSKKDDKTDAKDAAGFDYAKAIDAAVEKAAAVFANGLDAKIDASVKKALGLGDDKDDKKGTDDRQVDADSTDSSAVDSDASFVMTGIWGNK